MASRRTVIPSTLIGLVVVPALINLATGGTPDEWGTRQWALSGAAVVLALAVAVRERDQRYEQPSLDAVLNNLADAISSQWTTEMGTRNLNEPRPFPLGWKVAPAELTTPLSTLHLAASEWWPAPEGGWARSTALAGDDLDLAEVLLRRAPTRRLLVLGGAGSGKTVALVRLVLRLLKLRGTPKGVNAVPVLYSLASWDPKHTGLYDWLETRLSNDHPQLGETDGRGVTWARRLIDADLLLPVLDGFDELPAALRAAARDGINNEMRRGAGFVLSSRTEEFAELVDDNPGTAGRLHLTLAIEIESVRLPAARYYLAAEGGEERWSGVFAAATRSEPLREVLTTPLQISLARAIYNPRSEEPLDELPHPDELTDSDRFRDRAALDQHLFAGFLPAAYRQFPGQKPEPFCDKERAIRWLGLLAVWLEKRAVVDLAWWELREKVGAPVIALSVGALPALAVGLVAAFGDTLGMGLGLGILVALAVVFLPIGHPGNGSGRRHPNTFQLLMVPRRVGIVGGMAAGFVGGLLGALAGGMLCHVLRGTPVWAGLMGGLGAGIGAGAIGGRRRGFAGGLLGGMAVALTAGLGRGVVAGLVDGVAAWLAAGAVVVLTGLRRPAREVRALHYSKVGLVVGITVGLAIGTQVWLRSELRLGILAGIVVGVLGGLAAGLEGTTVDPNKIADPLSVLQRDRGTFLMVGTLGGLAFGLGAAFGVRPSVGLAAGLTVGLVAACVQSSYGPFVIARFWLAVRGDLPWRLMKFVDDAHRLGVLRQIGAVYQFRHIELQRYLARATSRYESTREAQERAAVGPHVRSATADG
ncbi:MULTISPECIES: NACHT domain-containing protein [unclassified Micromonospora]|uniref:NACHT domain-containing protein n=1 Tax=unclassified Micromonospora TaxID=2617518 RepID=UPI0033C60594